MTVFERDRGDRNKQAAAGILCAHRIAQFTCVSFNEIVLFQSSVRIACLHMINRNVTVSCLVASALQNAALFSSIDLSII